MLLWEIVTWGDSPYKNVAWLDSLCELIKVQRVKLSKMMVVFLSVLIGWPQNEQARTLPMEPVYGYEGLLDTPGIVIQSSLLD